MIKFDGHSLPCYLLFFVFPTSRRAHASTGGQFNCIHGRARFCGWRLNIWARYVYSLNAFLFLAHVEHALYPVWWTAFHKKHLQDENIGKQDQGNNDQSDLQTYSKNWNPIGRFREKRRNEKQEDSHSKKHGGDKTNSLSTLHWD